MAKNSIRDYSATNSSNTDIQSIDISEGCSPAGINNAIREVMADLKDVSTGAVALESPAADSLSVTGDLTVDTNTLYVDSTNNRVGIGLSSGIDGKLHVIGNTVVGSASTTAFSSFTSGGLDVAVGSGTKAFQVWDDNSTSTPRFIVERSGNVGIGNSTPSSFYSLADNLVVGTGSGGNGITIYSGSADSGFIGFNDTASASMQGFIQYNHSGDYMAFAPNGSEKMRITSAAKVGIGTTSISSTLEIVPPDTNSIIETHSFSASAQNHMQMKNNSGTEVGSIYVTTTSTSYNTSSDYRLKTEVTYDWDATTRLKQLKPARFKWIVAGDDAVPVDGFLAHEVQTVVPEAISGTKDAMRDEEYQVSAATGDIYTPATDDVAEVIHSTDVERPEELAEGQQWRETTPAVMGTRSVPDYQGIDQSKLVPLLVKTIQELEARITALEAN